MIMGQSDQLLVTLTHDHGWGVMARESALLAGPSAGGSPAPHAVIIPKYAPEPLDWAIYATTDRAASALRRSGTGGNRDKPNIASFTQPSAPRRQGR